MEKEFYNRVLLATDAALLAICKGAYNPSDFALIQSVKDSLETLKEDSLRKSKE